VPCWPAAAAPCQRCAHPATPDRPVDAGPAPLERGLRRLPPPSRPLDRPPDRPSARAAPHGLWRQHAHDMPQRRAHCATTRDRRTVAGCGHCDDCRPLLRRRWTACAAFRSGAFLPTTRPWINDTQWWRKVSRDLGAARACWRHNAGAGPDRPQRARASTSWAVGIDGTAPGRSTLIEPATTARRAADARSRPAASPAAR
jgi:hypothetical protein